MKRKICNILIPLFILPFSFFLKTGKAQTSPQQIMGSIYDAYDSIPYLTFDVRYTYGSDTIAGKYQNEVVEGTYTLAGKKAKYNLGDIEFMQNDSIFIAVYAKDAYIILSDPISKTSGTGIPMRQLLDSFLAVYETHYTVTVDSVDLLTKQIKFEKADSIAQFERFSITYSTDQFFLKSIEYVFYETPSDPELTQIVDILVQKKKLKIDFENYRGDNFSDAIYHYKNYIFYDNGAIRPVSKYSGFKIYDTRAGFVPGSTIDVAQ